MSTKYRNSASVAQERVLQLSEQWNSSLKASDGNNSNGESNSTSKVKPGKGLNKESHSSTPGAPEWEDQSNDSRTRSEAVREAEKQKQVPSTYAAEEDADLGDPDAEWKSGNAHWDSDKNGGGDKAKKS